MTSPSAVPSGRLLPAVWKLFRLRLRLNWNSFKHAKIGRKIGTVVLIIVILGVVGGIFYGSWLLLGFLNSPKFTQYTGFDPVSFLKTVPVLVLAALFLGILFSSFGVLLQALYLSNDMDFLLTSPVPIRAVFVTKMLQAVLPNLGLIALFGLPILFGLGISKHYNFIFYPLVLLIMITLTMAAAGISGLLVMLVARIFPPRRVAEVLGALTAVISILCGQSGNFYNAMKNDINVSGTQVNNFFSLLIRFNTPWNPLNWPGRGLVDIGEGHWLTGTLFVLVTLALSTVAFLVALGTSQRWYYTGWARMQVVTQKKKTAARKGARVGSVQPGPRAGSVAPSFIARLVPAPIRAIIQKDFLLLRRDTRNVSQLITPLIFGVLYTLMFLRPGNSVIPDTPDMPATVQSSMHFIQTFGSIGMALFVGWILLTRLSGMAFSSEGGNYWILKASPVRAGHMLVAKFLVAYLPALSLGVIFLVGVSILQKASPGLFLYGLLSTALCLAGMTGMLLAFGVMGANFNWTDPRRMNAGSIGCLGQILTAFFVPISFGMFIGPLLLASLLTWPQSIGYLIGAIAGVVTCLAAALLPPWLVRKRVERLSEN